MVSKLWYLNEEKLNLCYEMEVKKCEIPYQTKTPVTFQ